MSSSISSGVKDFLKGTNKADSTEVCTEVAPEVVQEQVRPQEHVETAEAIDREKHIHHHQHRVQPVEDHQVLPTQHVNSTAPTIEREHKEDMLPEHQAKLHEQRTQYRDQKVVADTERTASNLGSHVGTHEHHHIHETVQPVIQRETVQPTTVHHVQAIHEKIHEAPIVHEATTLPTISQSEFLKQKGSEVPESHAEPGHKHQYYEGAPKIGGQHNHSA